MKHRYLVILLCLLAGKVATAQHGGDHALAVSASLSTGVVRDTNDLKCRILVRNNSNHTIKVYKFLVEGYSQDSFTNFNVEVEQKGPKGFHGYSRGGIVSNGAF
jgi:hypothetical protein